MNYVEAVLAARASLDGGRVEDALSAAGALERSYPGAAGGPWLRCAASARTRNGDVTAEACRAAERAAPWAVEPVALLGVAAGNQGRWSEARDAFRRALERDPLDLDSWARLGVALEKLGDGAGLEELRRRYREKFGMTLAPDW
jgi:Flp pilus assembly protein TadD